VDIGAFGNILLIIFLTSYTDFILGLLVSKNKREGVKERNGRLDKLRTKKVKTLEEQKEFINLKYPKSNFKFRWGMIPGVLLKMGRFVFIYFVYNLILNYFEIRVPLGIAILILVVAPMFINYFLKKVGLNKDSPLDLI